jgi:hypothetical protein
MVSRALDVDVVVVMFDAVFGVNFVVNLAPQSGKQPPFVDHAVKKCDKQTVEDDLPDQFRGDVGWVESDCPQFIPKRHSGFVRLGGERSYVHSPSIALLRMIVNN